MTNALISKKIFSSMVWWAAVFGLLFVSQTHIELVLFLFQRTWLSHLIDPSLLDNNAIALATVVTPFRGLIFLYSLVFLSHPVYQSIRQSQPDIRIKNSHLLETILLITLLCILFTPATKLGGLAEEYSNSSLVMFTKLKTVNYYRRFLMPAIAHVLFFRGDLFYLVFSYICAGLFIFILRLWFETNHIPVSIWKFISLGTISFVYFQFQTPGYPDVLLNIFILLAFVFKLDARANLSLFVLSLASHEASLIIWFALAFQLFDRRGFLQFLVISVSYLLLLFSFNDGISGVLSTRGVGGVSNIMWVINFPLKEILGILLSYKAMWIIVISAICYLWTRRDYKEIFQILLVLCMGVVLTFMGVDTSRLFGWTFMAILASWRILAHSEGNWRKLIDPILLINFAVPSVNILLILEPSFAPGFYQIAFRYFFNH